MISKEEIEEMKKYINECILKDTVYEEELTIDCMKVAKEYIDYLESDKQKLIEKLEEDIKRVNCGEVLSIRSILKDCLEILKGENDE